MNDILKNLISIGLECALHLRDQGKFSTANKEKKQYYIHHVFTLYF